METKTKTINGQKWIQVTTPNPNIDHTFYVAKCINHKCENSTFPVRMDNVARHSGRCRPCHKIHMSEILKKNNKGNIVKLRTEKKILVDAIKRSIGKVNPGPILIDALVDIGEMKKREL